MDIMDGMDLMDGGEGEDSGFPIELGNDRSSNGAPDNSEKNCCFRFEMTDRGGPVLGSFVS